MIRNENNLPRYIFQRNLKEKGFEKTFWITTSEPDSL